jgi:hypothetical protein
MSNLVHHEGLIVPAHVIENREPPKEFVKRLQLIFGRDLHVTWHVMKKRFVIEQCIEHCGSRAESADGVVVHTHLCRRVYVWLVRDEATNEYMPLGDRVIAKLQEMETYRKYGTGPEALARFRAESASFDRDQAVKKKEDAHGVFQYLKRHNRIVRNKLKTMMGRHDWLRPHK